LFNLQRPIKLELGIIKTTENTQGKEEVTQGQSWRKAEREVKENGGGDKTGKLADKQTGDVERQRKNVEERKKSGHVFIIKANRSTKGTDPSLYLCLCICIIQQACKIF
jgi:hypothetical protein